MSDRSAITNALRSRWIHRLAYEWSTLNVRLLRGALHTPVFTLLASEQQLGQWDHRTRTLGIAEHHIWTAPWDAVIDTLKHEMAHQFACEVLGGAGEVSHGPAFREACHRLGIGAVASGAPAGAPDKRLERIQKLLALAQSSNRNEAEAAMAAANTLLLRYNLELGDLGDRPAYATRRIGQPAATISLEKKLVASILGEFFFVDCIWVTAYSARLDRDERVLEVMGTHANIDLAGYVHDFLHGECERWWRRERASLGSRQSRTARREFGVGVLTAFRDKLRAERSANRERGLIWLGDPGLGAFVRARYPRIRAMASGTGVRRSEALERGREVGGAMTLRRGVAATGAASERALPPRRSE